MREAWGRLVSGAVIAALLPAVFALPAAAAPTASWTIASGSGPGFLLGVTCVASADCWAVGQNSTDYYGASTLIEHWGGVNWSSVSSPDQPSSANVLRAVSCVASVDCWAVGWYLNGAAPQTLTEHWDGTKWSIASSPDQNARGNILFGVNCVASTDCWAAGRYLNGSSVLQTLTEHWDGTIWSIVPSPQQGTGDNSLAGVTCVASADCWAVGSPSLTEHWNGTAWSIVSNPGGGGLAGVTCMASADCWAVGSPGLTEHWDGTMWTLVSNSIGGRLFGVSCVASANCWAVGEGLTEHWDGTMWTAVSSPNPGDSILREVACVASADCWAVGDFQDSISPPHEILIEHYAPITTTTTTLASSGVAVGQANTDAATVTGGAASGSPTGTVTFYVCGPLSSAQGCATGGRDVGGSSLTPGANNTATASSPDFAPPAAGTWCFRGVYSGDANYGSSYDGSSSECFTATRTNTSMTETTSPPTISYGSQDKLSESGLPADATGTVTFSSDTTMLCTAFLPSASCLTSTSLAVGNYSVTAAYPGDPKYNGTVASGASFIVKKADTSMTESASPATITYGAQDTLAYSGLPSAATGNVTFTSGATTLCSVNLPSTSCMTSTTLGPGTYDVTATYSGDSNHNGSSTTGATFTVTRTLTFQDTDPSVAYGSWLGVSDSSANGGTYRISAAKGATATFKFSGAGITWVTRKGPNQGIASVTIDGVAEGNVDLYATTAQWFSQGYAGLASKGHTIVITVTGTKDAASSGKNVVLDAFIVGFNTIQDSSTYVVYDSWTGASSASASAGTYRVSPKAGATISTTFTGIGVDWVTAMGPSAGMASVTIDGVSMGTYDLYAPSVQWQVVKSYSHLATGSHHIVITVLGTSNASSVDTEVVLDAFVVHQ